MKSPYTTAVCLLVALPLLADEGRIPVYGVTTISQPGHYILTRDIPSGSSTAITISSSDVTLDLGGRTITRTLGATAAVQISAGFRDVVVKNGRIRGGVTGVYYNSGSRTRVRIENLDIDGASYGIRLVGVEEVEIKGCRISNASTEGISLLGGSDTFKAAIIDNTLTDVSGYGMYLFGLEHGVVRDNRLSEFGTGVSLRAGIFISSNASWPGGGNLIQQNEVGSSDNDSGISIDANSHGNVIRGNIARSNGAYGIEIHSSATNNLIENNQCQDNGFYGLEAGGASNRYRDNMLLDNGAGAVTGGQNEGGNITS